jgi:intracellular sulfur oxidation DsrE/DsrF family protein
MSHDEQINAYIDDELAHEDCKHLFGQMEQNPQLCQEAHELRQLRAMLRHAYRTPPLPASQKSPRNDRRSGLNAIAASLLLVMGALFGWLGNAQLGSESRAFAQISSAAVTPQNVLLHLDSNDPQKMAAALDYAEQFLASYRQQGRPAHLELMTNDRGTELLRSDTSPFSQRIRALQNEYSNISLLACANALDRLREQGTRVELLPGTHSNRSAIETIVQRLENGWHYFKI